MHGYIVCDANHNGQFDAADILVPGMPVKVVNLAGSFSATASTDSNGHFLVTLRDTPDSRALTDENQELQRTFADQAAGNILGLRLSERLLRARRWRPSGASPRSSCTTSRTWPPSSPSPCRIFRATTTTRRVPT